MKKMLLALVLILSIILLSGCDIEPPKTTSYQEASKDNEEAVKSLISNDVLPKVTKSLERENIKRRIEFINQADRIGYLYLLTDSGQLIREEQVLGKVSSLNSYLTPMEDIQIISGSGRVLNPSEFYDNRSILSIGGIVTTQASDLDGTYGENVDGIFWFTPDGVYREFVGGSHLYSAERLTFTSQPILIEYVEDKE